MYTVSTKKITFKYTEWEMRRKSKWHARNKQLSTKESTDRGVWNKKEVRCTYNKEQNGNRPSFFTIYFKYK